MGEQCARVLDAVLSLSTGLRGQISPSGPVLERLLFSVQLTKRNTNRASHFVHCKKAL